VAGSLDLWAMDGCCWSIRVHILQIRSNLPLSVTDLILVLSIASPGNLGTVYMLFVLDNC
jgi:hypothetical protein